MTVTLIQGLWKEGSKTKKFIMKVLVIKRRINSTTYCTYGNKKKNKPKPSIIVIMIAREKRAHPDHLLYLYLWQHNQKKNE
jgi:hypothetical protein